MAKASLVGKDIALDSIANNILSKLNQQDTRKVTAKLCQDKEGQFFFKIPCFTGKSVRYARPVGQSWKP